MKSIKHPCLWTLASLVVACAAPPEESQPFVPIVISDVEPPAQQSGVHEFPWTEAFMQPALLMADEITIEAPQGLLQHSVCRYDVEFHTRTERVLEHGYLQEIVSTAPDAPEIRCQLDGLQIAALRRIRLIETPGRSTVVVRATGDAYWKEVATGAEQRGATLEFTGEVKE